MKRQFSLLVIVFILLQVSLIKTEASTINLSTFDIVDTSITFSGVENSSATIREDPIVSPVVLLDYDLIIPVNAATLSFDYRLTVGENNEDYFDFYLGDLSTPYFWEGGVEGIYSGTITESVSPYSSGNVPIAFSLIYGFSDSFFELTSTLEISNVQFTQSPIPEPSSFFLVVTGLLGLVGYGRKKL